MVIFHSYVTVYQRVNVGQFSDLWIKKSEVASPCFSNEKNVAVMAFHPQKFISKGRGFDHVSSIAISFLSSTPVFSDLVIYLPVN